MLTSLLSLVLASTSYTALPQHGTDLVSLTATAVIALFFDESDFEVKCSTFCHERFHALLFHVVIYFIPHLYLCRSVVEICQHMKRYSGPKVLMGDFNSIPYSKEMAYLRGEVPLEGTYCRGLTDVWRERPQYRNMAAKPSDSAGFTFSAIEEYPVKRVRICHYMVECVYMFVFNREWSVLCCVVVCACVCVCG